MNQPKTHQDTDVLEREETQSEEPPMYACVLLNDDYTTFEFVVEVLMTVFNKSIEESILLTKKIHHEGEGVAGIYPKQIAEFKQKKAMHLAQEEDHPLQCIIRPETPAPKRGPKL